MGLFIIRFSNFGRRCSKRKSLGIHIRQNNFEGIFSRYNLWESGIVFVGFHNFSYAGAVGPNEL